MSNYSNLINEFIASLTIPKRPANLYDPIRYTLAQGGKRLRPELCLIACHTLGGNPKQALYPAVALELLHNFTLIHDDIMDQSELRRGQESVYKKWGANTAILAGDTLLGMAYYLMLKYSTIGSNKCYSLMTTTFIQICEGQQMDMDFERRKVVPVEEYLEMIRLKTSVLLGATPPPRSRTPFTTSASTSGWPSRSRTTCWMSTARRKSWAKPSVTTSPTTKRPTSPPRRWNCCKGKSWPH